MVCLESSPLYGDLGLYFEEPSPLYCGSGTQFGVFDEEDNGVSQDIYFGVSEEKDDDVSSKAKADEISMTSTSVVI